MLKYFIYCDFTTIKCNYKQFANFLSEYTDDYENLGNGMWLINIEDSETPFYNDLSNIVDDLKSAGYADNDSIIYSALYSEFCRHPRF